MRLAGKLALVTGGGSGLGREIALAYGEEGAAVVVASNVGVENEAVAEACGGTAATLDVRDEEAVSALFARLDRLDVLVTAAGLDVRRTEKREDRYVASASLEDWQTVVDVNLTGTFLCARAAARRMVEQGSGSIVTFTSGTVSRPVPGVSAYVASKAGIEGLTSVLAAELAGTGVRANVLQPGGMTDTGFFPAWTSREERARMHDPAVIRACAVYLASDESAGVNGESFVATEWNSERGFRLCGCPACAG